MKLYLFKDQYNNIFTSTSITALKREQGIPSKIFPIFVNRGEKVIKVGQGIGKHWFTKYEAIECEVQP